VKIGFLWDPDSGDPSASAFNVCEVAMAAAVSLSGPDPDPEPLKTENDLEAGDEFTVLRVGKEAPGVTTVSPKSTDTVPKGPSFRRPRLPGMRKRFMVQQF